MITDKDRDFAKALVSLAREHGAGKLSVDFTLSSSRNTFLKNESGDYVHFEDVKMHWEEGRHGARQKIHLSASVFLQTEEDAPPSVAEGEP